jgi:hypothetical protein
VVAAAVLFASLNVSEEFVVKKVDQVRRPITFHFATPFAHESKSH